MSNVINSKINIRTGFQTGADQGAADAAIEQQLPLFGWVPKGKIDEKGRIPNRFLDYCGNNIKETESEKPEQRTEYNVRDSDATLVLIPETGFNKSKGTTYTIDMCKKYDKRYLIINFQSNENNQKKTLDWIKQNKVKMLNVAGPRESEFSGMHDLSYNFLEKCISDILEKHS